MGQPDETVPLLPSDRHRTKLSPPAENHAVNRKTQRMERRELLYGVVRDSMTRAGVLASSYNFKVLSMDARGRQYLVMMDLFDHSAGDTARLAAIEATMAQAAKMRHDILVAAVYWRVNEPLTTGLMQSPVAVVSRVTPDSPAAKPTLAPHYQPLQQEEVTAFKRALAATAAKESAPVAGKIVRSGRRNPVPPEEFEDTQLVDPDDQHLPLSSTQYGDLN